MFTIYIDLRGVQAGKITAHVLASTEPFKCVLQYRSESMLLMPLSPTLEWRGCHGALAGLNTAAEPKLVTSDVDLSHSA
jgi:hypothetical protein